MMIHFVGGPLDGYNVSFDELCRQGYAVRCAMPRLGEPFPSKPFTFALTVNNGHLDRRITLYSAGPPRADEPSDEAWLYWDADML